MTAMDFRQYDNALGRFHGVDLLAELDYSGSPYSFGFNNPVYFSDPSGLTPQEGEPEPPANANNPIELDEVVIVRQPKKSGGHSIFLDISYAAAQFPSGNAAAFGIVDFGGSGGGGGGIASMSPMGLAASNQALISAARMKNLVTTPQPSKFKMRHLVSPDAIFIAATEDLGIGVGVGFEQGIIIILRGPDVGIYPAYDFSIGLYSPAGSIGVEAVKLYYSGDVVTKDVFYGNRYEVNFGADALGHIGLTGVYAPMKDGNMVWGYGVSLGFGFSPTIFSGNINYGRTQNSGLNMIRNLIKNN